MRKYRLEIPAFDTTIVVGSDRVLSTEPIFHAAVGSDFSAFRTYCEKLGWRIEPMLERPSSVEYKGDVFELHWTGDMVTRITLWHEEEEGRDITFSELPEVIRDMI